MQNPQTVSRIAQLHSALLCKPVEMMLPRVLPLSSMLRAAAV